MEEQASAYFDYALSDDCLPLKKGDPGIDSLDKEVLDERCLSHNQLLSLIPDAKFSSETFQILLSRLRSQLLKLNYPNYVLSLSGGVDSMLHLFMLNILRKELGFGLAACHIRHSSRTEDPAKEEQWVSHVCSLIDVPIFSHHVEVGRPHGDVKSGVSRDDFEELTRKVRFSMYSKTFNIQFNETSPIVIVAHHMDDVDENRLAELGKGTIVDIDGMGVSENVLGVTVIRPLCHDTRKDEIIQAAQDMFMPYMHNSTPTWSRRGWIRAVIDGIENKQSLLDSLTTAGNLSACISSQLSLSIESWTASGGLSELTLECDTKAGNRKVKCVTLQLGLLFDSLVPKLNSQLEDFADLVKTIASIWNPSVNIHASLTDRSCPIQPIKNVDLDDPRAFLLLETLSSCYSRLSSFIKYQLPSRSSVWSLCSSTFSSTRPVVSAMLHKSCPVVYLPTSRLLVLVDDFDALVGAVGGRAEYAANAILRSLA